jgi:hypothetical protein
VMRGSIMTMMVVRRPHQHHKPRSNVCLHDYLDTVPPLPFLT